MTELYRLERFFSAVLTDERARIKNEERKNGSLRFALVAWNSDPDPVADLGLWGLELAWDGRGGRACKTRSSARENATNLARQVVLRIGLGKELHVWIEPAVMNDGIGCIAGGEEHREGWARL